MKNFSDKGFEIEGKIIPWGETFETIQKQLKGEVISSPYSSGRWHHIRCEHAYGFNTTEFEIGATAPDKPVMQVCYSLAPIESNPKCIDASIWINRITRAVGQPEKQSGKLRYTLEKHSSSVVYNATWTVGNVRLTISTYSGVRINDVGDMSVAGIFIDWTDEITAAKPYLEKVRDFEKKLVISEDVFPKAFVIQLYKKQTPYYIPDYYLDNPDVAKGNEELRCSQRALGCPKLFNTPALMSRNMNEYSIAFWHVGDWLVLSNKWDSVLVHLSNEDDIGWSNWLPAKGSGHMSLSVNGLDIEDYHSSKALTSLIDKINTYLTDKITCEEYYDC